MFERRLKIILTIICCFAAVMLIRAVQLQVGQHKHWNDRAAESMKTTTPIETSRGRILDRNGKPLAFDAACIDCAVDYRAIALNDAWLEEQARLRMPPKGEALPPGATRKDLLAQEKEHVKAEIDRMWGTIGTICQKSPEEIEHIKEDIQDRVTVLQRTEWFRHYQHGQKNQTAAEEEPAWKKWLIGEGTSEGEDQQDASLDASSIDIKELREPHVIVADISDEQQAALQKVRSHCPGLVLMESTHRRYDPDAAKVAAHVLGHLAPVSDKEREADPYNATTRPSGYLPRELIGRDGFERLAEPILRGAKGEELRVLGKHEPEVLNAPVPGRDARLSIDIELQKQIDAAFEQKITVEEADHPKQEFGNLHGAAVVLDVETGQVLVMVSHPSYDLNEFEAKFSDLAADDLNKPLLNRATQQALPPGSMCKTIIGSVAVTRGFVTPTEGIECDGHLKIPPGDPNTKREFTKSYRCWTGVLGGEKNIYAHHLVPLQHHSEFGHPDGWLSLDDAIERSCNVYFETVAWRMKLPVVIEALQTFGLGKPTGIGIPEARGLVPSLGHGDVESTTFLAGIGQGAVSATPLQMANVAATLARGGIWVRPTLFMDESDNRLAREYRPVSKAAFAEDRVDLHLSPNGLKAIHLGMIRVIQNESGTGPSNKDVDGIRDYFKSMDLAGKTGSAQISDDSLRVKVPDGHGGFERTEDGKGYVKETYPIGSFPWFQGTGEKRDHLAHAWVMGYAPASKPRIAFCVLVEYGGSGGRIAGRIAKSVLEACEHHGYLHKMSSPIPVAGVAAELMHDQ